MRLFLRTFLIFFILLIVLSYPISLFISNHFYTYNKQNWVLNLKEYDLDYAALGSSRVCNVIDTKTLDLAWGKKGINLGTSGSGYAENYLLLSEFIKKNKISKLLLNIDEYSFNSKNSFSYPFHDFEFLTLYSDYAPVFYDFIPSWKYYLWKTLPVSKYCEFNTTYTLKKTTHPLLDKNMGAVIVNENEKDENKKSTLASKKSQEVQNTLDEKYFLKTLELCTKNKIEIILITTPIYSNKADKFRDFGHEYIKDHPALAQLPYVDFHDLVDYSNVDYFSDHTHTNIKGSLFYSEALGKKLKNLSL